MTMEFIDCWKAYSRAFAKSTTTWKRKIKYHKLLDLVCLMNKSTHNNLSTTWYLDWTATVATKAENNEEIWAQL